MSSKTSNSAKPTFTATENAKAAKATKGLEAKDIDKVMEKARKANLDLRFIMNGSHR
jgi:hypothetical protein